MSIIIAIIVFSLLIMFHEFGHFAAAKLADVEVQEFSIGMGPALVSKKLGETKYSIRAIPMGGYCALLDDDEEGQSGRAMNDKSVPVRMGIIAAGPIMNFLISFAFVFILLGYSGYIDPVIDSLMPGYSAESAGLLPGDRILSLDGQHVNVYDDLSLILETYDGEGSIPILVSRDGQRLRFEITPMKEEGTGRFLVGFHPEIKLGFYSPPVEGYDRAGIFETIVTSGHTMVYHVSSTVKGVFRILTFRASADEVAGPIGIVSIIGEGYEEGMKFSPFLAFANILYLMALLSDNLGVVNLLPIPGLDGGRLFILLIEGIRKKPIPPEKENVIHMIGLCLVLLLMVFTLSNDIMKLIG